MAIKWVKLLFKVTIWLALEIVLNLLGFDDIADYSEFILENKKTYVHQIYNGNSALTIQRSFKKSFSSQTYSFPL